MAPIECFDLRGQIFTHVDSKTGVNTVYAVTDIRRACESSRAEIFVVSIDRPDVDMVRRNRGLEKHRVIRAMQTKLWQPLIFAAQRDDTMLLIDGSHTFVARFLLGHKQANAYVVPERVWRHYTVDGMPTRTEEILLNSWSGIP